jgi:hypothetical protein
MPRFSAREIGRIETSYTSELGELTWEWVIRVDGTVRYRLNRVGGKAERNPWQLAYRLTPAQRRLLDAEPGRTGDLLARIARSAATTRPARPPATATAPSQPPDPPPRTAPPGASVNMPS